MSVYHYYLKSDFKKRLVRFTDASNSLIENDGHLSVTQIQAIIPLLFSLVSYWWSSNHRRLWR